MRICCLSDSRGVQESLAKGFGGESGVLGASQLVHRLVVVTVRTYDGLHESGIIDGRHESVIAYSEGSDN